MNASPIQILGAPGSPYSRKLRAAVRYRQIPFRWVLRNSKDDQDTPEVPVSLIPILTLPDGSSMVDSTFQIQRLEEFYSERSLVHPDPAMAFIDRLLEDFGDEWVTKCMFHYRWAFEADVAKAGAILPLWSKIDLPAQILANFSKTISERQVGRLGVVGSNPTTGPLIETSYRELLGALDRLMQRQHFLMGGRPGVGDFALFGQLTQLALFDPTPMAIAQEESARVLAWLEVVEDLSGYGVADDDWLPRDQARATLGEILELVGRYYAPFLIGNAAALEAGADQVDCEIGGRRWVQKPFPYQGKCLGWLQEEYASLSSDDRKAVDGCLEGTGCDVLFSNEV